MHGETTEHLILASGSPQRRRLLEQAGYSFTVDPSRIDEPSLAEPSIPPVHVAEALAYFKARNVADRCDGGIILGADTVVSGNGRLYGKAADAVQAKQILSDLVRSPHQVITGVAVLYGPDRKRLISHATTTVHMRAVSESAIDDYISTGQWIDKAGAYGIQAGADAFVERLDGSFTNVVGLPMELVHQLLAGVGVCPVHVPH